MKTSKVLIIICVFCTLACSTMVQDNQDSVSVTSDIIKVDSNVCFSEQELLIVKRSLEPLFDKYPDEYIVYRFEAYKEGKVLDVVCLNELIPSKLKAEVEETILIELSKVSTDFINCSLVIDFGNNKVYIPIYEEIELDIIDTSMIDFR